jgi:hypothetical protein
MLTARKPGQISFAYERGLIAWRILSEIILLSMENIRLRVKPYMLVAKLSRAETCKAVLVYLPPKRHARNAAIHGSGFFEFMEREESPQKRPSMDMMTLMHLFQSAFETSPFWHKAKHTPLENDLAVIAAEAIRKHLEIG